MRIILVLLFCLPFFASAQLPPPQATVELDWEPIENAQAYEVKLEPKDGGETIIIKSVENKISQRVPVGEYNVRIRSQDKKSGYFGKWSPGISIEVSSKVVKLIAPEDNAVLSDFSGEEAEIEFRWDANADARQYTIKIWSDNEAEAQEIPVSDTLYKLKLPLGRVYHWNVTFETNRAIKYQADPMTYSFSLLGKRLLRPEIDPVVVTTKDATTIKWSESPEATGYKTQVSFRYLDETEYQALAQDTVSTTSWSTQRFKPGAYKIEVTATASLRMNSEPAIYEFVQKPTEQELNKALEPTGHMGAKPARAKK
jgi:hypothetical protein